MVFDRLRSALPGTSTGTYGSVAIANTLWDIAEKGQLDPLKAQKLVYFCHGWNLGLGSGPLCSEHAQAWRWGPVFRNLYRAAKRWGGSPILKPLMVTATVGRFDVQQFIPRISAEDDIALNLVERVWDVYGHLDEMTLSRLTHASDGPWFHTFMNSDPFSPSPAIPNRLITEYFRAQADRQAQIRSGSGANDGSGWGSGSGAGLGSEAGSGSEHSGHGPTTP